MTEATQVREGGKFLSVPDVAVRRACPATAGTVFQVSLSRPARHPTLTPPTRPRATTAETPWHGVPFPQHFGCSQPAGPFFFARNRDDSDDSISDFRYLLSMN